MNRFAVSMTIFVVLAGAGSFLAYESGRHSYEVKEAAKEQAAEEAKKQAEAAAAAGTGGAAGGATEVQVVGNVQQGETIYTANCVACHGANAGGAIGPKLAKSEVVGWTQAQFKETMYEGKTPTRTLNQTMPRFGQTGFGGSGKPPSDQEIADLHAYLKSL